MLMPLFVFYNLQALGYTDFEVQYYTAPIYACAFVGILAFCFSSDLFQERAWHIVAASALSVVCFAIILGVLDNTGRYVLLCFGVAGVYAACECRSIRHNATRGWLTNCFSLQALSSAYTYQMPASQS